MIITLYVASRYIFITLPFTFLIYSCPRGLFSKTHLLVKQGYYMPTNHIGGRIKLVLFGNNVIFSLYFSFCAYTLQAL